MACSRVLIFLFCLSTLAWSVHTRSVEEDGAPEEQEPGDAYDQSLDGGSGDDSRPAVTVQPSAEPTLNDKMRWVTYSKAHGTVHEATEEEAQGVITRHSLPNNHQQSIDCNSGREIKTPIGIVYELDESSGGGDDSNTAAAEDGEEPDVSDAAKDRAKRRSSSTPASADQSFERVDTTRYPGFATGLLRSKNCTAFLVGKVSALTLAECVYDVKTKKWNHDLDLWRGRNCKTYIGLMAWESVTIPRQYYTNGNEDYNWAYIKYEASSASENWIGMSFDCHLTQKAEVHVTLSGYQKEEELGCPFQSPCLLLGKKQQTFCPSSSMFAFPGSPLVAAPSGPTNSVSNYIGTSPRLYGIAGNSVQPSINKLTMITEEMFWLVYSLMDYHNDQPQCDTTRRQWFINRILKT